MPSCISSVLLDNPNNSSDHPHNRGFQKTTMSAWNKKHKEFWLSLEKKIGHVCRKSSLDCWNYIKSLWWSKMTLNFQRTKLHSKVLDEMLNSCEHFKTVIKSMKYQGILAQNASKITESKIIISQYRATTQRPIKCLMAGDNFLSFFLSFFFFFFQTLQQQDCCDIFTFFPQPVWTWQWSHKVQ